MSDFFFADSVDTMVYTQGTPEFASPTFQAELELTAPGWVDLDSNHPDITAEIAMELKLGADADLAYDQDAHEVAEFLLASDGLDARMEAVPDLLRQVLNATAHTIDIAFATQNYQGAVAAIQLQQTVAKALSDVSLINAVNDTTEVMHDALGDINVLGTTASDRDLDIAEGRLASALDVYSQLSLVEALARQTIALNPHAAGLISHHMSQVHRAADGILASYVDTIMTRATATV